MINLKGMTRKTYQIYCFGHLHFSRNPFRTSSWLSWVLGHGCVLYTLIKIFSKRKKNLLEQLNLGLDHFWVSIRIARDGVLTPSSVNYNHSHYRLIWHPTPHTSSNPNRKYPPCLTTPLLLRRLEETLSYIALLLGHIIQSTFSFIKAKTALPNPL